MGAERPSTPTLVHALTHAHAHTHTREHSHDQAPTSRVLGPLGLGTTPLRARGLIRDHAPRAAFARHRVILIIDRGSL